MSTQEARQEELGSSTALQGRALLLELVAQHFDQGHVFWQSFNTLRDVEHTDPAVFRATPTDDTVFAPVVERLHELGYLVDRQLGSVMDVLGLTQHDVHEIACACHWDGQVKGQHMGFALRLHRARPGEGPKIAAAYMQRLLREGPEFNPAMFEPLFKAAAE